MQRMRFSGSVAAILICAAPVAALAWEPGYPTDGSRMASRALAVDTGNRDEVVAFWHAVYQASEGYENRVGWTGRFPDDPGTTSPVFVKDVERRINFFRAMAGLPASTRVNTGSKVLIFDSDRFKPAAHVTKAAACQKDALMIAASYDPKGGTVPGMSHNPSPGVPQWSAAAWNAASKSNLAFGSYGPGAVTEYAVEELLANAATSEWNSLVGHRRWLLASRATDFATGDFPGRSAERPPTNALYVIHRPAELAAVPNPTFVSYPPAGYLPAFLNSRFWSLSHKDADFSNATVKVTDAAGKTVPVTGVQKDSSYGDPAIVWQVSGSAAARSVSADRRFRVTVQGIQGFGVPESLQYEITLIHPNALRRVSPVTGPGTASAGSTVTLKIKPIAGARKTRMIQYQRANKAWLEGGEGLKPDVIDGTSTIYPLLATSAGQKGAGAISGTKSFNLTFPNTYDLLQRGVAEQTMELGPWIHTKAGSELKFLYRRGLMSEASSLVVEGSSDLGNTWKRIGNVIKGYADARPDTTTLSATYKLPSSTKPLRVRFRYFYTVNAGGLTTHTDFPGFPTGIFLDDIQLIRCDRLVVRKAREMIKSSTPFQVPDSAVVGEQWVFGLESEFGGGWLQTGPFKTLRVVE